jgi:hypothetical protein
MTLSAPAVLPAEPALDPRIQKPLQLAERAQLFKVTRETKVEAEELILALNDAEKAARAVLDPICEATHVAWKTATTKRAGVLTPIESARTYLRRECGTIQRVLDQEAEAEARRRADVLAAEERARLQAQAEQLADTDVESAMEILDEAEHVLTVPVSTMKVEPVKAAGLTYRDNWTFSYVDDKGRAIEKPDVRLIPAEYLKVDEVALRRVVGGLKDRTNIPGVRAFNDRLPVGSGGRK